MDIGYARVSTDDQRLDLQTKSLTAAGCNRIFKDKGISGSRFQRPGLDKALRTLREGDSLVVWRLDRLGRSLPELVTLVESLGERGIQFQSLTEAFDTRSSAGKLIFHIMAALAEFERSLISERTKAGMQAASERGRRLGRPPLLNTTDIEIIQHEIKQHGSNVGDLARRFNVSERTIARCLNPNSR